MSLICKSKPISSTDQIERQSFEEWFCDEMCEHILQYLPFIEKFRLECVSKQFQRTIFKRVSSVDIKSMKCNLEVIESVLKKCPHIRYISMNDRYYENEEKAVEYNLIIDLIIKYCNQLTKIECYNDLMNDTNKQKFFEKFGSKLKKMYLHFSDTSDVNVLQLTQNIKEFNLTIINPNVDYSQIKFKELKKLDLHFNGNDFSGFPTIIANNPLIKDFSVYCFIEDREEFAKLLNTISEMKHLERLQMQGSPKLNEKLFETSFGKIAVNCLKLKTISCDIGIDFDNNPQLDGLLSTLRVFKQIRRLELWLFFDELFQIENFSFKVFNGFEFLIHLELYFVVESDDYLLNDSDSTDDVIYIKDTILEDIAINLPKLQYLSIGPSNVYFIASHWTHHLLKRLPFLNTIILNVSDDDIKDMIQTKLNEHKKYKTIDL